jgi:hypothetical protein
MATVTHDLAAAVDIIGDAGVAAKGAEVGHLSTSRRSAPLRLVTSLEGAPLDGVPTRSASARDALRDVCTTLSVVRGWLASGAWERLG